MRFVAPLFVAVLSGLAGFAGVRWVAQPGSPLAKASPAAQEERTTRAESSVVTTATSTTVEDRVEALAKLCEEPAGAARDRALMAALLKMEAADFTAGAGEILALFTRLGKRFGSGAGELAEAWMDRWLELDTPGALRFLGGSTFLSELPADDATWRALADRGDSAGGAVFKVLARRQPEWTRQTLAAMKPGARREIGVFALMREAARRGSAEGKALLAGFADGPDRREALSGYVAGVAAANARAGFEAVADEPPGPLREELLTQVFNHAGKQGVSAARELLDRIGDPAERRKLAATALSAIGFERREDALPFVKEESERMAASGGWKAEMREWASAVEVAARGPQARTFADWAAGFAPDAGREMLGQIAQVWSGRAPAEFQGWLSERAATLDAGAVEKLGPALANSARRDLAGARAWAETLPPGALRDQARFQVALGSGAEGDLAQAEAAYRSVAAGDTKGALAKQLADVIAKRDGAAAAEWATRQPPGAARKAALEVVAERWSGRDPHGMAQWLETLPTGAERDKAVRTYASRVVLAEPEAAAQWAEQVADPEIRKQAAHGVYFFWSLQNPAAAREWLRGLPGMEEGMLEKILRNSR